MSEIVPFRRKAPIPIGAPGRTALAVKCSERVISPELRAIALAWLRREHAALARRLQIEAMPARIRARLEVEIKRVDATLAEVQED
jgi:hypothetical protein